MVTSFRDFRIEWKLVSSQTEAENVISEYESETPIKGSKKKYHLTKVVSPDGEKRSYSTT